MNHMMLINPETEFPNVEKMLYNLAWKTANTYPVTFEEARSEAYWAFMNACRDFNPTKAKGSKFSSWCYFWVWTHLKTFVTKRSVDPLCFVEMNEDLVGTAPAERSESLDLIEDLSEDAKEIISLLLETPEELIGMSLTTRQLVKGVKNYLVKKKKRNKEKVDKAFEEARIHLQEAWA